MKFFRCFVCLFFTLPVLAQQGNYTQDMAPFMQPTVAITLTLTLEDYVKREYVLRWNPYQTAPKDAAGNTEKEWHCYVRDSKGVVGFYRGTPASTTQCAFTTYDTLVDVFFMVRPNANFSPAKTDAGCDRSEYHKVKLSLNQPGQKVVILANNSNVVYYNYHNAGASIQDNLPCGRNGVMVLNRYYVSLKNGKIRRGSTWLETKRVGTIAEELQLQLIDPAKHYHNKNMRGFTGKELIKRGRIKLEEFNLNQFSDNPDQFPY